MLTCRACLRRHIQALDTSSSHVSHLRRGAAFQFAFGRQTLFGRTSARSIHNVETQPSFLSQVDKLSKAENEPWKESPQAVAVKKRERQALKTHETRKRKTEVGPTRKLGKRDPSMSTRDWNRRKKELQYLKDPLELASFVKKQLAMDKGTEMLQLVRMASHSMQCIVSWNHIIDYHLAKQRVSHALKIYNEMKKRAQFPDSYTYTILLRGLSINAHRSGVLSHALSVYHSMFAPNSRVKPAIIHANAVLRVCARTLDMDALWGIAAKIPDNGPGAANVITYITILNAVRQNLLVNAPTGETEEEVAARREQGILEGRRLWEEVVRKWRDADIVIDEELVCAMGRLLLVGSRPRDWDDVLSLVEQTMDIPRLVPRLGTPARYEAGYPHLRAPQVLEQYRYDDDHLSSSKPDIRGDEFLALAPNGLDDAISNTLTYAKPSNNTLSMVQEACQKVVANKAADEYWDLLTDPTTYGIVPDINNLHMRLRLLRQNRASASALQLLKEAFVEKGIQPRPGTFRIAMSTCVRDKNNHNSLKHASQILYIMTTALEDVDPKAVTMYAELAIAFPLAKGADLVDALTFLRPVIKNIKLQLSIGGERKNGNGVGATYLTGQERQYAIQALRRIYGVFDRLLLSGMLSEKQKSPFEAERARLGAFIQRINFKDGERKKRKEAPEAGLEANDENNSAREGNTKLEN